MRAENVRTASVLSTFGNPQEAAQRFGEKLAPHLQEAGITAEPEVYEADAFVSA